MPNGDICIPFSCGFQFEKVEEFVPEEVSIKVTFSIRAAFKLTGLKNIKRVVSFM